MAFTASFSRFERKGEKGRGGMWERLEGVPRRGWVREGYSKTLDIELYVAWCTMCDREGWNY